MYSNSRFCVPKISVTFIHSCKRSIYFTAFYLLYIRATMIKKIWYNFGVIAPKLKITHLHFSPHVYLLKNNLQLVVFSTHLLLLVVNHNKISTTFDAVLSAFMPVLLHSSGLSVRKEIAARVENKPSKRTFATSWTWNKQVIYVSLATLLHNI